MNQGGPAPTRVGGKSTEKLRWNLSGPCLLAILFALLTVWSWRKWPDITIDFGRELYVPWQITLGKVLYKDIAHLFGPFSSHFNALMFSLFGVSLTTIIVTNLVLLAITTTMIFWLIRESTDQLTATIACVAFLSIFAFGQYTLVGNFNFICPYSHEATHGIILVTVMICLLWRSMIRRAAVYSFMAGVSFGLILLTKLEVALAAFGPIICYLCVEVFLKRMESGRTRLLVANLALGALLPIAACLAYLGVNMPFRKAVEGIFGQWIAAVTTDIAGTYFYVKRMGTDEAWENVSRMLSSWVSLFFLLGSLAVAAWLYRFVGRRRVLRWCYFCGLGLLMLGFVTRFPAYSRWGDVGFSLPLWTLLALVFLGAAFVNGWSRNRGAAVRMMPMLLWGSMALILLAKVVLNTRISHYGFYLAMPSFLLIVVSLLYYSPALLTRMHEKSGKLLKYMMAGLVILCVFHYLQEADYLYGLKTLRIGRGGDTIISFPDQRARTVSSFLTQADEVIPNKAGFVVIPEGVMLNYLLRRENPTPFTNFMVPELVVFGEDAMLRRFEEIGPEFFVILHRRTSEYGVGFFGRDWDYGRRIMDWIGSEYTAVFLIGAEPLRDDGFGLKVMRKRSSRHERGYDLG